MYVACIKESRIIPHLKCKFDLKLFLLLKLIDRFFVQIPTSQFNFPVSRSLIVLERILIKMALSATQGQSRPTHKKLVNRHSKRCVKGTEIKDTPRKQVQNLLVNYSTYIVYFIMIMRDFINIKKKLGYFRRRFFVGSKLF